MLRFISLFILFLALYTLLRFFIRQIFSPGKRRSRSEPEELVQDPYCQTYIPKGSALKKRIAGKNHYFCNPECFKKFLERGPLSSSQ